MRSIALISLPDQASLAIPPSLIARLLDRALDVAEDIASPGDRLVLSGGPLPPGLRDRVGTLFFHDPGAPEATSLLPVHPGARERLRAFAVENALHDAAVVFINALNPATTSTLVREAMDAFKRDPSRPLLSVCNCRDHPCQYLRYALLSELDMLYLLDPGYDLTSLPMTGSTKDLLVSHPFRFSPEEAVFWEARPGQLASCVDGRVLDGLEDGQAMLLLPGSKARMVFETSPESDALLGHGGGAPLGLFGHYRRQGVLAADPRSGEATLYFSRDFPWQTPLMLRLVPMTPDIAHWEHTQEIESPGRNPEGHRVGARPPGVTSYMACFLEPPQNGRFDLIENFQPPEATWAVRDGLLVNLQTGVAIFGRQAFPDVVQHDGTFAVMPLATAIEGGGDLSGHGFFKLDEADSLIVTDAIDQLRYQSRQTTLASGNHE